MNMNKFSVLFIAALFSLGLALQPTAAYAIEAKVGVAMMYDWWKPGFLKMEIDRAGSYGVRNVKTNLDGSFMIGPTLWLKLAENWGLGATMLFGVSRNEIQYSSIALDSNVLYLTVPSIPWASYIDIGKSKVRRYDLDVNLENAFHKYFSLLIGVRFNYDDGEGSSVRLLDTISPFGLNWKDEYFSAWYLGPSLGIGFHVEPVQGLTLSLGASALIQFGAYYLDKYTLIPLASNYMHSKYDVGYFCVGLDSNVKIAYLISPINVEVWIGGRYILLTHVSAGDNGSVLDVSYKTGWITGELEHFGGIMLGAAYKF
jgi:hypothetical protein